MASCLDRTAVKQAVLGGFLMIAPDRTGLEDPVLGTETDRNLPGIAVNRQCSLAKFLMIPPDRTGLEDPVLGTEIDRNSADFSCSRLLRYA